MLDEYSYHVVYQSVAFVGSLMIASHRKHYCFDGTVVLLVFDYFEQH